MPARLHVVPDLPGDETPPAPKRALVYARTSVDKQRRGKSVDSQIDSCQRECDYRRWVVTHTLRDDDRSASSRAKRAREGWQDAVDLIEAGEVDVLVTWEWSRATRDLSVYVDLEKVLQRRGVLLAYQGDVYDLRKAGDRRRVAADAVESQYEADRTSERALRNKATDAENGHPAGSVPFGYRRVYDPRSGAYLKQEPDEPGLPGRAADDPPTAPLVRELAERFLAGETLNHLANDFNRRGIRTPKPPRKEKSRGWTASTVGQVLRGPSIAGLRIHQRKGEPTRFYPAKWSAIITAEQRDEILTIMADPSRVLHRGTEPTHLLSHLAVCSECGVPVRHKVKRQRGALYPAYQCTKTGCGGVYIQATAADNLVTQAVLAIMSDPTSRAALNRGRGAVTASRAEAQQLLADLLVEKAELETAWAAHLIKAMPYALALGDLEGRIEAARDAAQVRTVGPAALRLADADDVPGEWATMPMSEKRAIIRTTFEVRLHPAAVHGTRRWDPRRVELVPLQAV